MVDKDILTTRVSCGIRLYSWLQARGAAADMGEASVYVYVYMYVRLMQPPEGDT